MWWSNSISVVNCPGSFLLFLAGIAIVYVAVSDAYPDVWR